MVKKERILELATRIVDARKLLHSLEGELDALLGELASSRSTPGNETFTQPNPAVRMNVVDLQASLAASLQRSEVESVKRALTAAELKQNYEAVRAARNYLVHGTAGWHSAKPDKATNGEPFLKDAEFAMRHYGDASVPAKILFLFDRAPTVAFDADQICRLFADGTKVDTIRVALNRLHRQDRIHRVEIGRYGSILNQVGKDLASEAPKSRSAYWASEAAKED